MARVEKNQPMAEEMSHMKGDILKAVQKGKSKRPWLRSCAALVVLATLAIAIFAAWIVASTRLVRVPVLSGLAYEKPSPVRTVAPGLSLEAYMSGGSFRGSFDDIPESTLTATVRDALATNGQTWLDDHSAQAARIDGLGIELFLPLSNNAMGTAIVAHVGLSDDGGKMSVSVDDLFVGSLAIPKWLIASVVMPAITPVVAALNENIQ
jgi:hypothetical protein